MHRFLLVVVLLLHLSSPAQIDQKKVDSLAHSIDSSAKAYKSYQDRLSKVQDSIYHTSLARDTQLSQNNSTNFLEEKERKERQRTIVRILISVVVLIAAVIVLLRRRKLKT